MASDKANAHQKGQSDQGMSRTPYHPLHYKKRFCASYPNVGQCRRGKTCAFAHNRQELRVPLLPEEEEKQFPKDMSCEFFMQRYKTLWCPVGVQHDWLKCPYAHNYQDARRPVEIGYGPKLCPFWSKTNVSEEYAQRCPLGLRCPYAHGAKEQLYHPMYFRTAVCRDLRGRACPRGDLCAFFHKRNERRQAGQQHINYDQPLPEISLPGQWISEFLAQPFHGTEGNGKGAADGMGAPPAEIPGAAAAAAHLEANHQWLTAVQAAAAAMNLGMHQWPTEEWDAAAVQHMQQLHGFPAAPGLQGKPQSPCTQSTASGEGDEEAAADETGLVLDGSLGNSSASTAHWFENLDAVAACAAADAAAATYAAAAGRAALNPWLMAGAPVAPPPPYLGGPIPDAWSWQAAAQAHEANFW
eukprot:TRINITY_DN25786_c0_g1_i1.p1 TRINITY_DN25786_c0_g1~~TRINITY_DN25786_c0_g1_i1.p1  ORF type:complete len:433 (+),score=91.67 TRINITY_DN25786_c0_g1_i1:66-1301(+)